MPRTLYVELLPPEGDAVKLRYSLDDPNKYEERTLSTAEIRDLIDTAEETYYRAKSVDLVSVGQRLYAWLDGADRFLERTLEACRGAADVLVLAIATPPTPRTGAPPPYRLDHLPWESLHDGTTFLAERTYPHVTPVRWTRSARPAGEPANRPLRVLFMATSPLDVEPVLDFEEEEAQILEATARHPLTLTVEESGCLNDLQFLADAHGEGHFDVVHLSGHADHTANGPRFITETELGDPHLASAKEIAEALHRMPGSSSSPGAGRARQVVPGRSPPSPLSYWTVGPEPSSGGDDRSLT